MPGNETPGLETIASIVAAFEGRSAHPAILSFVGGEQRSWTYADLAGQTLEIARELRKSGIQPRETVALLGANCPEWVAAYLGIVLSGATVAPLDPLLDAQTIWDLIRRSGSRHIFIDRAQREKLEHNQIDATRHFWMLDRDEDRGERSLDRTPLPTCNTADTAALLFTSGTTGRPKGVPLSHRNICSNVEALAAEGLITPGDRVLLPLPLHHAYPMTVGCLGTLAYGATLVFPAGLTGGELTHALRAGRASVMIAVPRLLSGIAAGVENKVATQGWFARTAFRALFAASLWLRQRLGLRLGRLFFRPLHRALGPHLRLIASGGALLEQDLAWTLEALGWEILTGYGLTETSPIVTFTRRGNARFDSVGQAVAGVEIRLARQPAGGFGEIEIRGPNVFSGYRDLPNETARAFTEDGWFRTEDLGQLDERGFLHLAGRVKEMIVLPDGKNVFPEPIEEVFIQSPLMQEAAILQEKDGLVLLIVADEEALRAQGAASLSVLLRDEIERLSRARPSYERISGFAVTGQPLPRTTLGKLKRHLLPEMYRHAAGAKAQPPKDLSVDLDPDAFEDLRATEIWGWLRERFPDKALTLQASPQLDLGIDSLGWVELTLEIERRFGARLTEAEVSRILTVRDLITAILSAESDRDPDTADPLVSAPDPPGPFGRIIGFSIYLLNYAVLQLGFHLTVKGSRNIPAEGPFILVPNHVSYLDPFALAAALPWSRMPRTFWAGWTGLLFMGPVSRWFSRTTNILPVDPDRRPGMAVSLGIAVLKKGNSLVWFPEGRRSVSGQLLPFLPGIGHVVQQAMPVIIPVSIAGSYEAWPATRRWPSLRKITVTFGTPIVPETLVPQSSDSEGAAAISAQLHKEVAALQARP